MRHIAPIFRLTESGSNHALLLGQLILVLILLPGLLSTASAQVSPAGGSRPAVSPQQREHDAAMQHQLYRERVAAGSKQQGQRTLALRPAPEVGIAIRRDIQSAGTIFFYDDMESGVNGWTTDTHGDTVIGWHQTTRDANSPEHSWWNGIEAQGDYNTGHRMNSAIISPAINLASAIGPVALLFTENYETERSWDYCMVDVTSDGGTTWNPLRGVYAHSASGSSGGWQISTLDLSAYAGSQINVRFHLDTGDSLHNDFPGWFVDNVTVFDHAAGISGTVYFDWNQNGALDNGEHGLGGWLVRATGPITITTRSDWSGAYHLTLPLGLYQVSEIRSDPWTQTAPPSSSWSVDLTTPGQAEGQKDFGNYRLGTFILGRAFDDVNRDSIWNPEELPLAGHTIVLYSPTGLPSVTATDSAGNYSFVVFDIGTYAVADYLTGGRVSSVPGGSARYAVPVIAMGQIRSGYNFGSFQLASDGVIGGILFNDLDQNGIQDPHDPVLPGTTVTLGIGNWRAYCATDDSGKFRFDGLLPGTYHVWAAMDYTWRQSAPETLCTVPLAETQTVDNILLGVYRLPIGSIRGTVFNDLNRNGVRDSLEPILPGWTVSSIGPEPPMWAGRRWATTDSAGRYTFSALLSGLHEISIQTPAHWRSSVPDGEIAVPIAEAQDKDSVDFGVYLLRTGSISGVVFDDLNVNQLQDSGEAGLSGWEIQLTGSQSASTISDDSGHYRFDGLWAGSFRTNMVLRSHWRQTVPDSLQPHFIWVGDEDDYGPSNFGLVYDTAFTLSFRSFLPESLSLARDAKNKFGPVLLKADRCLFQYAFVNTGTSPAIQLLVIARNASRPGSLTASQGTLTTDAGQKILQITFSPSLSPGDSVIVAGTGVKPGLQSIRQTAFTFEDGSPSSAARINEMKNTLGYPMPNALNALSAGAGTGLRVGVGGPHSVVHPTYKEVMKSLFDSHGGPVVGPPTCLGTYTDHPGQSIKKQLKYLPPTKQNNRMFSEAIALKANIRASELWITPPGFGKLIFQDTAANICNGLPVTKIAANVDTAMSAFDDYRRVRLPDGTITWVGSNVCLYGDDVFAQLFRAARMIDSAFSGPIDTVSFRRGLVFKPVRSLADVPFLHLDSSFSAIGVTDARPGEVSAVPDRFTLSQNYPNPFNPTTTIEFNLTGESFVTLKIYNTLGQQVATLIDHQQTADGWTQVDFSADQYGLASGVYYYRLVAEPVRDEEDGTATGPALTSVKKMMIMK